MRKRAFCALLALALLLSLALPAFAEGQPPLKTVSDPEGFPPMPIYMDGLLRLRGYRLLEGSYIPLGALCECLGIRLDWSADDQSLHVKLGELPVEGQAEQPWLEADGRYIWAPEYWFVYDGELYMPQWPVCKLLNLSGEEWGASLRLDTSKLSILKGGKDYYELNFPTGDLYWLSHIIASEAGIEPMEGKIGVGNVVLNRVADPEFPDTVFGVVFDHEHTIQFEPVSKGTIHEDPKPEDTIAACMVLEGADTAGNCIYFVNPDFGSFWFDNNLDFVKKLGRHNFYVSKGTQYAGTSFGTAPAPGA